MRKFLFENRRRITAIIIVIIAVIMSRYIIDNFASFEKRILSNNAKVVYQNKRVYIRNINIDGITNSPNFHIEYTLLDVDSDGNDELLLEFSSSDNFVYFIVRNEKKQYVMYGPADLDMAKEVKTNGCMLTLDGAISHIKLEDNKIYLEKLAYMSETGGVTSYIVNENAVSKQEYEAYVNENYTSYASSTWVIK